MCSEGTEDQLTVSILDLQSASEECNIAKEGSRVTLMVLPDKKFKFKTPVAKANTFPILFKKSFSFAVGNEASNELCVMKTRSSLFSRFLKRREKLEVPEKTI